MAAHTFVVPFPFLLDVYSITVVPVLTSGPSRVGWSHSSIPAFVVLGYTLPLKSALAGLVRARCWLRAPLLPDRFL